MPTDSENTINLGSGMLFMTDANGKQIDLGPCSSIGTIEADPVDKNVVGRINTGAEATFTCTVHSRRMSRKRFVKKLMGYRVPRNVANSMADIVWLYDKSYAWGFFVINASGYLPWEN
jgi:hypothetical protein